jgi:hypothetical protein
MSALKRGGARFEALKRGRFFHHFAEQGLARELPLHLVSLPMLHISLTRLAGNAMADKSADRMADKYENVMRIAY